MFKKKIVKASSQILFGLACGSVVYYNYSNPLGKPKESHKILPINPEIPTFTMDEVRQHNKLNDAWIVVSGKVYNITDLLSWHPGGSGILKEYIGGDATRQFMSIRHSMMAKAEQANLCIGEVKDYENVIEQQKQEDEKKIQELNKPRQRKHIIIVGNGICGVAVAYFLSLAGIYDITVVDKSYLVG